MNRDIFFLIFYLLLRLRRHPANSTGSHFASGHRRGDGRRRVGHPAAFFFSGRSRAGTSTRRTENDLFDDDDGGGDAGHSTMTDAARARTKNVKSNFKKWKKKLPIHRRRREMTVRHVLVGDVFGRRPFARRGLDLKP